MNWPPDYKLRRSSRARHPSLRISVRHGLEIVLPMRYSLANVPGLLQEKRRWLEKHRQVLEQSVNHSAAPVLPQQIYLASTHEHWKINYWANANKPQIILRPQNELIVFGHVDDKKACFQALNQWVRQRSEEILVPRLHSLSQELNFPFSELTIRNQKTRWGSCSAKKSINLNFKLIFLSPDLVRHIMLHELCHTIHLNHSKNFWKLLAKHDPHWEIHHRLSRRNDHPLPFWLDE